MNKIRTARPWVEPGLYVECPYCNESILLESDYSISEADIPTGDEAYEYECDKCSKVFLVTGDDTEERDPR